MLSCLKSEKDAGKVQPRCGDREYIEYRLVRMNYSRTEVLERLNVVLHQV